MQELNKLETLRDIIDKGEYIVALCGSGMMEECGIHPLKDQDRAYRIEERYGRSPEYLYTDALPLIHVPKPFMTFIGMNYW